MQHHEARALLIADLRRRGAVISPISDAIHDVLVEVRGATARLHLSAALLERICWAASQSPAQLTTLLDFLWEGIGPGGAGGATPRR